MKKFLILMAMSVAVQVMCPFASAAAQHNAA